MHYYDRSADRVGCNIKSAFLTSLDHKEAIHNYGNQSCLLKSYGIEI